MISIVPAKPARIEQPHAAPSRSFDLHAQRRFGAVLERLAAAIILAALLPPLCVVAILVGVDVGWPVLTWRLRHSGDGRQVRCYRFRTLKPAFDTQGFVRPERERLSWFGSGLRQWGIDRLPNLANVVTGDVRLGYTLG